MVAETLSEFVEIDRTRSRFRVRRDVYNDPAVLERERRTIFDVCWLYLAHESELANAGDFVTRNVGGRNLIATCDKDGRVHAFLNICTHRGSLVCREAKGSRRTFSCPYHGWVFGLDGALKNMNAPTGYDPALAASGDLDLPQVPRLEQYRGFWFVNYDKDACSLSDYLGPVKRYLDLTADQWEAGLEVVQGEQILNCHGNWKMIPENVCDSYHVGLLHSTYIDYIQGRTQSTAAAGGLYGRGLALGNGHCAVETNTPLGRPIAQWIPPWGAEAKAIIDGIKADLTRRHGAERAEHIANGTHNVVIFPNTVLNDGLSISIRTINPAGPDRLLFSAWPLAPKGEPALLRKIRFENYLTFTGPGGFATPDDVEVWDLCQKASHLEGQPGWNELSKGFTPTQDPLDAAGSATDEVQIRAWWAQYDRLIGGGGKPGVNLAGPKAQAETEAMLAGAPKVAAE